MTAQSRSSTTVRRIGAVLTILLAANVHILVRTSDVYRVGYRHHEIFAWVSLGAFWLGLAYLVVSIGYALVVGTAPEPGHRGRPTDD